MTDYAISTRSVSRTFGDVRAVDDLSLDVRVGEVFGFLGHNGAGKTTTIRLLNGVLTPDSGQISVLGHDPQTDGTRLRARTGVLTETPSLDERMTAFDNLTFYANLYALPEQQIRQHVTSALERFGLLERGGDKVGGFSKGMKQRLALARAFLHDPDLIFLDEPTAGLDPIASQEVHDMIRHVSHDKGRTVFLCTHNLVEAQNLCDRVAILERGRLLAIGSPRELAQNIGAKLRYTVEIDAEQRNAALAVINTVNDVGDVEPTDEGISFAVIDRARIPELLAKLVAADVRVYAASAQSVSLEDIYMALHKRGEASS